MRRSPPNPEPLFNEERIVDGTIVLALPGSHVKGNDSDKAC